MKKLLIICILLAVMLTACGSQTQTAAPEQTGNAPGFGGNNADLYGEVKSISGTEVTLALIELPQQRFNGGQGGGQAAGNNRNQGNGQAQGNNRTRPSARPDASPRPDAGNGSNGSNASRQNNGGRSFSNMQRNYTGETVTLNIPASTPISTYERGDNGMTEKQLSFADIKEGSLLQVWYKKDSGDSKEIDKIRLTQIPTSDPASGNSEATTQGQ